MRGGGGGGEKEVSYQRKGRRGGGGGWGKVEREEWRGGKGDKREMNEGDNKGTEEKWGKRINMHMPSKGKYKGSKKKRPLQEKPIEDLTREG